MSSHRKQQVSGQLQKAIQQTISKGLHDPRIRGLITVTAVDVSSDYRDATVRISVLPHEHEDLTLHGIKDAAKHIRRQAGELIAMKRLPALHFKLDTSLRKQAEVIEALAKERSDDATPTGGEAAEGPNT